MRSLPLAVPLPAGVESPLRPGADTDLRGRPLRELRLGVTDRCNLRCGYCMPRHRYPPGTAFLPRQDLLSYEELARVAGVAVSLGVEKIRLTGGEPLLRRDLPELVRRLAPLGVELAVTTNGWLLAEQAAALRSAGLDRLNVSLDALDPETFQRMADVRGSPERVLEGLRRAEEVGFAPPKINCVVRRDMNPHAPLQLLRHFRDTPRELRFIEYMDVGCSNGWRRELVVTGRELLELLGREVVLEPLPARRGSEVARRYQVRGSPLSVGLITSVSEPFCGGCTRLRVTASGQVHTCLFGQRRLDLRGLLRAGASDEALSAALSALWRAREDRYSELRGGPASAAPRAEMSELGG